MTLWFNPALEVASDRQHNEIRSRLAKNMIPHLSRNFGRLKFHESKFVRSLMARYNGDYSHVRISLKQFSWLASLCVRTDYKIYDSDLWMEIEAAVAG